ncbi:hypothetical protein ACN4EK_01945 [Pantanalinema rosaneae CENA516]|uniref:hypothetical protein n=1 Tax=Pantanalinema rosaneae TaxID=1620701 RepID=UPI003D6E063A
MSSLLQTALIEWMPLPEDQDRLVSIYRTSHSIEMHPGCEKHPTARLISTHRSYADAYEFAELLAQETGLPIRDLANDQPL